MQKLFGLETRILSKNNTNYIQTNKSVKRNINNLKINISKCTTGKFYVSIG